MARKYHSVRLNGEEFRLRITFGGQKRIRKRFNEEPLSIATTAAYDLDKLSAFFDEALNWEGSGNSITSGEAFYDLLVDCGYDGYEKFNCLIMDVVAASGMLNAGVVRELKDAVNQNIVSGYQHIIDSVKGESSEEETQPEENPTTRPEG